MSEVPPIKSQQSTGAVDSGLRRFGLFIDLERKVRNAEDETEFGFLVVNETHNLVSYRQSILWQSTTMGFGKVLSVSGLSSTDPDAPFVQWVKNVCQHLEEQGQNVALRELQPVDLPDGLRADWDQWLPSCAVWLSLRGRQSEPLGALILAREESWSEAEKHLLTYLADTYGHAWWAMRQQKSFWWKRALPRKRIIWWALAASLVVALFPVRQSVLAPAVVVAKSPSHVRAPIDGVVDQVMVEPNDTVKTGDLLFTLDVTKLNSRLKVVEKALEVSRAELRQTEQRAVFDENSRVNISILKSRVQQQLAEVDYVQGLLQRSQIRATRDGMVIFDNVNDWIGRPVAVGEKVMLLATPSDMQVETWLPVSDAIKLSTGAEVKLFLNANPYSPIASTLTYASYEASLTPEGHFAYRLLSSLQERDEDLRIGLKGTAKIYGEQSLLFIYMLRKPLVALRQYLGW